MNEALEDAGNANSVLLAELEELAKAQKAAEEKAARLEEEQKECNRLVLQTDTLAYRKSFPFALSDYCPQAVFLPITFSFRYLSFRLPFRPDSLP
jgi:hypothetical protein